MKMIRKKNEVFLEILKNGEMSSSVLRASLVKTGSDASLVTIKRMLREMVKEKTIASTGQGRAVRYQAAVRGKVFADIDAAKYTAIEPDKRYGASGYNFELFSEFPNEIFDDGELKKVNEATKEYRERIKRVSPATQKKELERLVIELAWKSSRIEGNTYTLLDTERLILEHKKAPGHDAQEARMILNHKNAFDFIHEHREKFKTLDRKNLEHLHSILIDGMGVGRGLRKGLVGVTGSKYRPLDNVYQIGEAVDALAGAVRKMKTPYAKALMALLGISYIQPFEDGNKRTSRLMANALLLAHGCAPLSYRSLDENEYREATLVFYELNSVVPFKKIFVAQYGFAAEHYAVK